MSTDAVTITDEQVAEIADRQLTDGRRVSPLTIWSEIRGGSIVAIAQALQRWREARQPQSAPAEIRTALPADLSESFTGVAGRIWSAAQEEVETVMGERLAAVSTQLAAVATERALGWSRQLRLTPLHPVVYIAMKALVALVAATFSVAVVNLVGALKGTPQMPTSTWTGRTSCRS